MQLKKRESRGEIEIACKYCGFITTYSVSYIEDAIKYDLRLTCSVCETLFRVAVIPLRTITAQQSVEQDENINAQIRLQEN